MTSRNPNRASTMKAFYRFEAAAFEEAWKGSGDPDFFEDIEEEYQAARAAFIETLEALTK